MPEVNYNYYNYYNYDYNYNYDYIKDLVGVKGGKLLSMQKAVLPHSLNIARIFKVLV